jgi:hypothetical protein
LRRRGLDAVADKNTMKQPGNPVDGVTFGHALVGLTRFGDLAGRFEVVNLIDPA